LLSFCPIFSLSKRKHRSTPAFPERRRLEKRNQVATNTKYLGANNYYCHSNFSSAPVDPKVEAMIKIHEADLAR
jgi:hypothetical protein